MKNEATNLKEQFTNEGFIVLKNSINKNLIAQSKEITLKALNNIVGSSFDNIEESITTACKKFHQADVQSFLHQELQSQGIKSKILLTDQVLCFTKEVLGPDLSYNRGGAVCVNSRPTSDNLFMKKHHQEIWSGAGVNELRAWAPLYMPGSGGGLKLIPGSHTWGCIPNRERAPVDLPDNADTDELEPQVTEGDMVMFHSMTLHSTAENLSGQTRIAFTVGIRNFYHTFTGYEYFQSWQPYHFSPMAKIQKRLGNPLLTPYRTLGVPLSHRSEDDGFENLPYILE